MVLAGALAGLALGMASVRYIESLLYQVKPKPADADVATGCHCGGEFVAALPAVVRAVRIDPSSSLRSE